LSAESYESIINWLSPGVHSISVNTKVSLYKLTALEAAFNAVIILLPVAVTGFSVCNNSEPKK
jgi:hypothetical protein